LENAYQKKKIIFPGETASLGSPKSFEEMVQKLSKTDWIAYAKRPFAGPEQVLEYLGRYTHRVAISNNRIVNIDNGKIVFTYRDRQDNNEKKLMSLDANEFARRFLLHVLPQGFMKIRYFGFLSNIKKREYIPIIRQLIEPMANLPKKIKETVHQIMLRVAGIDISCCPQCQKGKMIKVKEYPRLVWNTS
jgi:hypothetical protein